MVFCDFAISHILFPVRSIWSYQILMYTFFIVFMHVRHVTRDSLQIALWHLLQMMFCLSFSFIWLTIVFFPYFVLSKVRNLSVGTVLQWIHFYCGSLEVNLMHDAHMHGDTYQGANVLCLITEVKQSWAWLIHGWVTILPALLHSVIHD